MQLATKPITTATKLATLQQWAKRTRTASEDCLRARSKSSSETSEHSEESDIRSLTRSEHDLARS